MISLNLLIRKDVFFMQIVLAPHPDENGYIKYPKTKTLFKLRHEGKQWTCTDGEIPPETAALHFF